MIFDLSLDIIIYGIVLFKKNILNTDVNHIMISRYISSCNLKSM